MSLKFGSWKRAFPKTKEPKADIVITQVCGSLVLFIHRSWSLCKSDPSKSPVVNYYAVIQVKNRSEPYWLSHKHTCSLCQTHARHGSPQQKGRVNKWIGDSVASFASVWQMEPFVSWCSCPVSWRKQRGVTENTKYWVVYFPLCCKLSQSRMEQDLVFIFTSVFRDG